MTAPTRCPPIGLTLPVELVKLRDADTPVVRLRNSPYEWAVRLIDCWCPEKNRGTPEEKEVARKAGVYAANVLADGDLRLYVPPSGDGPGESHSVNLLKLFTFDRVLGHLYVGPSQTLNRMLVSAGYASSTKGGELGR